MKLFEEQIARKPDYYPWTQKIITTTWNGFWTSNQFNFKSDIHDFKAELTEEERQIIIRTISAIGQIEIAVKKFWAKLGDNLPHPSIADMGYVLANTEVIHNIAYEKLLKVLDLEHSFEENLKVDVIEGRVKYLRKYLEKHYKDNRKQFIYSLVLFTLFVENISLFSQFFIISWFGRYKSLLKDTNNQILYTMKEELIHGQAGTILINTLRKQYPELFDEELNNRIISEAQESFKAESKIIDWLLQGYKNERINSDIIKEFVKYRINDSLLGIGFQKIYTIDSKLHRDFEWMIEEILANTMTDFFHKHPTEYSKNDTSYTEEDLGF